MKQQLICKSNEKSPCTSLQKMDRKGYFCFFRIQRFQVCLGTERDLPREIGEKTNWMKKLKWQHKLVVRGSTRWTAQKMRFIEEDCETTTNMSFSKNIGMTKNARKRMSNVQKDISFKKRMIQGKRTRLYLFQENIEIIQVYIYISLCMFWGTQSLELQSYNRRNNSLNWKKNG